MVIIGNSRDGAAATSSAFLGARALSRSHYSSPPRRTSSNSATQTDRVSVWHLANTRLHSAFRVPQSAFKWNPVLESHQSLRCCGPPPELLGQRDKKSKLVNAHYFKCAVR